MALIGAEAAVTSAVTFFAAAIAFAYLADSIGLRIVPAIVLVAAAAAANQRHSPLTQITPENVRRLTGQWAFQTDTSGKFEAIRKLERHETT